LFINIIRVFISDNPDFFYIVFKIIKILIQFIRYLSLWNITNDRNIRQNQTLFPTNIDWVWYNAKRLVTYVCIYSSTNWTKVFCDHKSTFNMFPVVRDYTCVLFSFLHIQRLKRTRTCIIFCVVVLILLDIEQHQHSAANYPEGMFGWRIRHNWTLLFFICFLLLFNYKWVDWPNLSAHDAVQTVLSLCTRCGCVSHDSKSMLIPFDYYFRDC
jgi:hypothetical protein